MLIALLAGISVFAGCCAIKLYRIVLIHKRSLRGEIRLQLNSMRADVSWITRQTQRFDCSVIGVKLAAELRQFHLSLQPSEYIAYYLLSIVVLTWVLCGMLGAPFWPALLLTIIAGNTAKRILVKTRKHKNIQLINKQLPEVCRVLANSMRAGLTIPQAFELAARETMMPTQAEFLQMHHEMQLGAEIETVLRRFAQRMHSPGIVLFVGIITNQRKIGSNLVLILEQMARTFDERRLLQEAVKSMTAESKYISYILPVVPIVMLVMMNSLIEGFVQPLLTVPGLCLLVFFIAVQAAAFVMVRKITRFRV